jgi:hypothetical protein
MKPFCEACGKRPKKRHFQRKAEGDLSIARYGEKDERSQNLPDASSLTLWRPPWGFPASRVLPGTMPQ